MRVSLCLSIFILGTLNCLAQQSRSVQILDERLKTSFWVSYPEELTCDLPSSFEDFKQCFSNLDMLEGTLIRMTKHMDEFLANEPNPFLEEPPKVYWVSEIQWAKGRVEEGDTISASMWCSVFPADGGTLIMYSEALELRKE